MTDLLDRLKAALADRYAIDRELGSGGMATVYLAEDLKHHRKVAVKVLRPELAAALGSERFLREVEVTANLTHPHILPLYDSGEADGFLYYVMPYVEGESLRERLNRDGKLSVQDGIRVTDHVASALSYAHERGVVHRDIKPENILLAGDQAIVADFGIARAVSAAGGDRLTGTGLAIGTPAYMSPEQAMGLEDVDGRSDVYSLGCVVYEMVGGRAPFEGTTPQALLAKHAADTVPSLRTSDPEIPLYVEGAVERALAKDRTERFQTPSEFAEALTTQTVVSREPGARRPVRWQRLGIGLAVSIGLLAAVVGGWFLAGAGGGTGVNDLSIAVLPFETLGQEQATAFTDGVHADVLTRLSSVSDLSVTSRTSVMRYRTSEQALPTIARELGVTWVLRGEVQETGNEVQVSARLVNARTDRQVWAQSYRRELTAANLFEMQSEITAQIARALETQLSPEEEQQVARTPTQNLDAYRLYVQGRGLLDQRTEDGMWRAGGYFRQAIDRDSSYAVAWAGLANALWLFEDYGYAEPGSLLPQAGEAARRALALDPDLAEAHAALGMLHYRNREGSDAIRELQLAVDLRASYADAYSWLRWVHSLVGHPNEALEMANRGVELDPLSPENLNGLSMAYLIHGDGERAVEEARRSREIQPDFATTHFYEAVALYHLGRMAEAKSILQDLAVPWAGSGPLSTMALAHVATGDTAHARELLDQLSEVDQPFDTGLVLAALGEEQLAFEAFQEVDRWEAWPTLAARYLYPEILGPLREDPRYELLLRNVDRSWGLNPVRER
jgi:serine/threonine-protein kinase